MRTKKSIINTAVSFLSQCILILLGFVSRRVLIDRVGVGYLGINGLMTNILTLFSLAESGIGTAIGFALYKPLADQDTEKIKSLMRFFKKTYQALAIGTVVIGLLFYPFLPFFLKDNTVSDANIVYLLFLFQSAVSYLWIYKNTLNNSDQNNYLYTIANTIAQILIMVLRIILLYFTENYILYLSIDIVTTIVKNLIFTHIVDRRYPYIKDKNIQKLDKVTKDALLTNIKALFWGKLGGIVSTSSDNLVISSIVGVTAVGMYSNYTTIISSVSGFTRTFSNGITASMGNLVATDSRERIYEVYKRIDFINYWLYTFSSICMFCLIHPLITIWLGKEYILSKEVLLLAVLIFYMQGINLSIDVAKNAAGLYKPDRFVPLLEAITNMILSIFLVRKYGIAGVLWGTLISYLLWSFWIKPYIVYKDIFVVSMRRYVQRKGVQISIAAGIAVITYLMTALVSADNAIWSFLIKLIISLFVSNGLFILIYIKSGELHYMKELMHTVIRHIRR